MVNNCSGKILVSIGEVHLEAPETLEYLNLASRLLEVRRQELNDESETLDPGRPITGTNNPAPMPEKGLVGVTEATREPVRRARWFTDRFPEITMEDGSKAVIRSLGELRLLLESRGLTPHPRGDASMLLWQIRNRLRLRVEPVGTQEGVDD